MAKTVTVRMDDRVYDLIRRAAEAQGQSVSSFLTYCALRYLADEATVSDQEMAEILADKDLVSSLRRGLADAESWRFRVAE